MESTKLIIVGGFLGAGKTSLLWEAAQQIIKKDLRVGLITNDQAPQLVDSALLSRNGLKVAEVNGSCFCCNFNGFINAVQTVQKEAVADVIIAEPVGSCTDLSATIMQPLKQLWGRELQVAPLSVLADPARLVSILDGGTADLHPDAAYIYRKQLEESDLILISKTDLLSSEALEELKNRTAKAYPASKIIAVSALSGEGIESWLYEVFQRKEAGIRLAEVDYDIYANGEAVLGWLNGTVSLHGAITDWDTFTHEFLSNLAMKFDCGSYPVGHVKMISENGDQFVAGNLTGNAGTLALRGSAGKSQDIKLTINARVETTPEKLNEIIKETLDALTHDKFDTNIIAWRYLQPGRPEPTHRFVQVV